MRSLPILIAVAATCGVTSVVCAQVPRPFLGTWAVDAEGTTRTISADPTMAVENKPGWTERWLTSGAELEIVETAIHVWGVGPGQMTFSVTQAETMTDGTLLVAMFLDPSGGAGMPVSLELRLGVGNDLNFRIREENDFDLVVWGRSDGVRGEPALAVPGDAIDYLNSLKTCTEGEFRFSYTGFGSYHNTVLGREGDRCRVRTERAQVRLV